MTRRALVRIPDGATLPEGWTFVGWYEPRPPRRYAVVTDSTAWEAWVKEHAPDEVWPCGHIDKAFESAVRKWVALCGTWQCNHCRDEDHPDGIEVAPDGMEARADSAVRIHVTTPDGSIDSWESPVDVSPEEVPA